MTVNIRVDGGAVAFYDDQGLDMPVKTNGNEAVGTKTNPLTGVVEIIDPATGLPLVTGGGQAFAVSTPQKLLSSPTSAAAHGTLTGAGNSVAYEVIDGAQVVSVTTGAGVSTTFNLAAFPAQILPNGQVTFAIKVDDMATLAALTFYIGDTSAYTGNAYQCQLSNASAFNFDGWYNICISPEAVGEWAGLSAAATNVDRRWSITAGTPSHTSTLFTNCKIVIAPQAGAIAKVSFAEVAVAQRNTKATLAITVDDGFIETYTAAAPIAEQYGFKLSMGIIGATVGTANYMTLAQLQSLVARGHEACTHGANSLSAYGTVPLKQAEIALNQDFLKNNGLNVNDSANCFIYPNSVFAEGSGATCDDSQIKQALNNLGFIGGRASGFSPTVYNTYSKKTVMPWVTEVGHRADTGSDALETANVGRVILKIQQMAKLGRNGCLTFHRIIPNTGGAAHVSNTEIQNQNFRQILDAIKVEVDAGRMDQVLFSTQIKRLIAVS